jgi:3-deoxy-manno-octulosonate cytidylyltransferase (CMP-KDO synthetase)
MIWWVWDNVCRAGGLSEVVVATDSDIIVRECAKHGIPAKLTSDKHSTGIDRIGEIRKEMKADVYMAVMGDEPLIQPEDISKVINSIDDSTYASILCTAFRDGVDLINTTTHKYVLNDDNDVIYISRFPIPYPQYRTDYVIHKGIGAIAYTEEALDFYVSCPVGRLESIEGVDLLRLLERRKPVKAVLTDNYCLSVDTPKDLERVRQIISQQTSQTAEGDSV